MSQPKERFAELGAFLQWARHGSIAFLDLSLTIERGFRHEATSLDFGACLSTGRCDRLPIGFELEAFGYDEPSDDWAAKS